ncbi:MAG TPA: hypothetical protein VI461_11245 [Chitinophagaceae bacterium]|nr:hypothetical protein [Chitinophagaceae bacterium]
MVARVQVGLFVILLMFIGFCGGMLTGSLFAPSGSGFTGPAIAFGYGIGGLLTGLIAGILLIRVLKQPGFRIALIITVITSLLLTGWIIYRVRSSKDQQNNTAINFEHRNNQKINAGFLHTALFENNDPALSTGMGIAKPHLSDGKLIYFYHLLPIGMQPYQIRPVDSIRIIKGVHHFEISYAPPWFFPEIMKLDYDILLLRALTISRDWMEVVVNRQTGQTYWIAAADAEYTEWSAFLLNVYDVELTDPETNPLRFKPLNDASIVATTPQRFSLKPLAIHGDWMMVPTLGLADRIMPYGWIRWRKDDKLLITYSLLS